jgi:hypothetical protein
LTLLGVSFAVLRDELTGALLVAILAAGNLLVFAPRLPAGLHRLAAGRRPGALAIYIQLMPRAVHSLVVNWRLWVIAMLGACVAYLDRLVALVIQPELLPLFTLIVMCFSVVQMAVDFYYISAHRRDFLQQRISVWQALTSRGFLGSAGAGLVTATGLAVIVLSVARHGEAFPRAYVVIVALLQAIVATTVIPQQILYWNQEFRRILAIEAATWVFFVAAACGGWWWGVPPLVCFGAIATGAAARLAGYVASAHRTASAMVPVRADAVV